MAEPSIRDLVLDRGLYFRWRMQLTPTQCEIVEYMRDHGSTGLTHWHPYSRRENDVLWELLRRCRREQQEIAEQERP